MATSRKSKKKTSDQSTFWSEAHLVKIFQSPASEQEWTASVVNSQSSSLILLADYGPDGWYTRTSPASCRLMEDGRLESFSESWGNSGMGSPTEFLTLNTLEYHSAAVASSLSDILETGDVPQRYYLSATACRGILRRAEKRGKALPGHLKVALETVAGPIPQMETEEVLLQEKPTTLLHALKLVAGDSSEPAIAVDKTVLSTPTPTRTLPSGASRPSGRKVRVVHRETSAKI